MIYENELNEYRIPNLLLCKCGQLF